MQTNILNFVKFITYIFSPEDSSTSIAKSDCCSKALPDQEGMGQIKLFFWLAVSLTVSVLIASFLQ